MNKELTRETIMQARQEYCNHHFTPPQQFNIQKFVFDDGVYEWTCEFMEEAEEWHLCTRWMSGKDALNIFWTCDEELLNLDLWDEQFNLTLKNKETVCDEVQE